MPEVNPNAPTGPLGCSRNPWFGESMLGKCSLFCCYCFIGPCFVFNQEQKFTTPMIIVTICWVFCHGIIGLLAGGIYAACIYEPSRPKGVVGAAQQAAGSESDSGW